MTKTTYYKVVSHNYRELTSAMITGVRKLVYHVGEWTHRTYWGPMVFKNVEDARKFMRENTVNGGNGYLEIWECEAHRVRKVTCSIPYADVFSQASESKLKVLLAGMKKPGSVYQSFMDWHSAPTGTYIAEEVKLVKRVG